MHWIHPPDKPSCPLECPGCKEGQPDGPPGEIRGWTMAAFAVGIFLFPLALAITGAMVLPRLWANENAEGAGGFAGLAIGVVVAIIIYRLFRSRAGRRR